MTDVGQAMKCKRMRPEWTDEDLWWATHAHQPHTDDRLARRPTEPHTACGRFLLSSQCEQVGHD